MYSKSRFTTLPAAAFLALALTLAGSAVAAPQADANNAPATTAQAANASKSQTTASQSKAENGHAKASTAAKSAASGAIVSKQTSSQKLASTIMGMPVKNGTGKKAAQIGSISDIVFDKNNNIVAVLVGVGGFLGIGQKNVGVPFDKVQFHTKTTKNKSPFAVVQVTKKQLSKAPAYETLADQKQKQKAQQARQKVRQEQQKTHQPPSPAPNVGGQAPSQ